MHRLIGNHRRHEKERSDTLVTSSAEGPAGAFADAQKAT